ncbi:Sensor protein rcsC [Cupriavidus basilensis]|uniref:Virulence sensor protein BvgS n=1 Tax=Cupriavidus basilensis TaxID=68895 RepID=A0A0C4YA79_9BURK|nr:Sensor protein rcsC [Cupriavidus basilensis]
MPFVVIPLALMLAGTLCWGIFRVVEDQQERIDIHFSELTGYIREQEAFLIRLRTRVRSLHPEDYTGDVKLRRIDSSAHGGVKLFEARVPSTSVMFSIACASTADCPATDSAVLRFGSFFSDYYSTYWAASQQPAADAFLIAAHADASVRMPALRFTPENRPQEYGAVLSMVAQHAGTHAGERDVASGAVSWLRADPAAGGAGKMLAVLPLDAAAARPRATESGNETLYAAALLSLDRIGNIRGSPETPGYDDFWLEDKARTTLAGKTPLPASKADGVTFATDGLYFRLKDPKGAWHALYRISYPTFFRHNKGLPVLLALLVLLGLGGALSFVRWYNRRVVLPARQARERLAQADAFCHALIETAPVALCIYSRADGAALFGNHLAKQWLNLDPGLDTHPDLQCVLDNPSQATQVLAAALPGTIGEIRGDGSRPLSLAFAPARYHGQAVLLCAFSDISARKETERALAKGGQDADSASAARTTFLASMSHEIRTPLYGVMGALELLELTSLGNVQGQYVQTIRNASEALMQIIGDVLDIARIEARQLSVEAEDFCLLSLVEATISRHAASAGQKGLLLYACVAPELPERLRGDSVRIQQILNNLLCNAIKSTESGHVILRVRQVSADRDGATLRFQVVDTGVGIPQECQAELFTPFHRIDSKLHAVSGAGLGLSICMRLATLMHGDIRVVSDPGLGSSFSLTLPLSHAAAQMPSQAPVLTGKSVYVRSPSKELTENVCAWLRRWGATTHTADDAPVDTARPAHLLDLLVSYPVPEGWSGNYLFAGNPPAAAHAALSAGRGNLSAHSVQAVGSAIALAGPVTSAPADRPAEPLAADARLRVLVAEDNAINGMILKEQLEQIGCLVALVRNGVDALARWHPDLFDVVITDINMPRANGYELAEALRQQGYPGPIVGITANAMREEEQRCLDAGMTSWLAKPFDVGALRAHLQFIRSPAVIPHAAHTVPRAPASQDEAGFVPIRFRNLFTETMRDDIAALNRAMVNASAGSALDTLHRMRGALATVKLFSLVKYCESLEEDIRSEGLQKKQKAGITLVTSQIEAILAEF